MTIRLWGGLAAALIMASFAASANAAEQGLRPHVKHSRVETSAAPDCGCCGCFVPEYVQHREILYSYPWDPRYTLTSEPRYTLGRVYTYLHNW